MRDRTVRAQVLIALLTCAIGLPAVFEQTVDPAWIRDFASPSAGAQKGRENALNGDPRFHLLLSSSLHQLQSFWRDHGKFTPVADLVHTFIGVPGDVLPDSDRYLTADGCVPHDCYDRGMVWIDTAANPAALIFVATSLVSNGPGDTASQCHLWLFSSIRQNWQKMPEPFPASLSRWNSSNVAKGYEARIVLVTLVQPDGEMVDLSPSLFSL